MNTFKSLQFLIQTFSSSTKLRNLFWFCLFLNSSKFLKILGKKLREKFEFYLQVQGSKRRGTFVSYLAARNPSNFFSLKNIKNWSLNSKYVTSARLSDMPFLFFEKTDRCHGGFFFKNWFFSEEFSFFSFAVPDSGNGTVHRISLLIFKLDSRNDRNPIIDQSFKSFPIWQWAKRFFFRS